MWSFVLANLLKSNVLTRRSAILHAVSADGSACFGKYVFKLASRMFSRLKHTSMPAQQRVLPGGLGIVCDIVGPNGLQVLPALLFFSWKQTPDASASANIPPVRLTRL